MNASGLFCGVAEMVGCVDFDKDKFCFFVKVCIGVSRKNFECFLFVLFLHF